MAERAGHQDPGRRAAEFWDRHHREAEGGAHDNFLNHPMIQAYVSLRAFGTLVGHLDAVIAELRSRSGPGDRVLSIGCGAAPKERALARALPDRQFVGLDIAAETVERTREECAVEGLVNLELEVGDFNDLDLAPASFGVVLGLGAIHHVERLEEFWSACAACLQPGGVVLAQEYVGADRFQWTDAQVEEGDRVLRDLVPDQHKVHHDRIRRVAVEEIAAIDPSEAVRSSEILSTCRDAGFEIEGQAGAGCALLQPVLMNQIATYDPRDWEHNRVLATLFADEDRLMREGRLADDFAMFVARPPA